jgi:hypothetical protein
MKLGWESKGILTKKKIAPSDLDGPIYGTPKGGGPKWSASRWSAANPKGDIEAAKRAAQSAGYQVVE